MHRDGVNPDNVQIEDVLCDFCEEAAWAQDIACVEGHRGALICGTCLTKAWIAVQAGLTDESGSECVLCLESQSDPMWKGASGGRFACRRCIKQSAGVLHKSPDWPWTKPPTA